MTHFSYICSKFVSQKLENLVMRYYMAIRAGPRSMELIGYSAQNKRSFELFPGN